MLPHFIRASNLNIFIETGGFYMFSKVFLSLDPLSIDDCKPHTHEVLRSTGPERQPLTLLVTGGGFSASD